MSYTPPVGNSADISLTSGYTAPSGDAADISLPQDQNTILIHDAIPISADSTLTVEDADGVLVLVVTSLVPNLFSTSLVVSGEPQLQLICGSELDLSKLDLVMGWDAWHEDPTKLQITSVSRPMYFWEGLREASELNVYALPTLQSTDFFLAPQANAFMCTLRKGEPPESEDREFSGALYSAATSMGYTEETIGDLLVKRGWGIISLGDCHPDEEDDWDVPGVTIGNGFSPNPYVTWSTNMRIEWGVDATKVQEPFGFFIRDRYDNKYWFAARIEQGQIDDAKGKYGPWLYDRQDKYNSAEFSDATLHAEYGTPWVEDTDDQVFAMQRSLAEGISDPTQAGIDIPTTISIAPVHGAPTKGAGTYEMEEGGTYSGRAYVSKPEIIRNVIVYLEYAANKIYFGYRVSEVDADIEAVDEDTFVLDETESVIQNKSLVFRLNNMDDLCGSRIYSYNMKLLGTAFVMPPVTDNWWQGKARSYETLLSGEDGEFVFRISVFCQATNIGVLKHPGEVMDQNHCITFSKGDFHIIPTYDVRRPYIGHYTSNDVFAIRRENEKDIRFYKNGVLLYRSQTALEGDVRLQARMYGDGDTVYDARLYKAPNWMVSYETGFTRKNISEVHRIAYRFWGPRSAYVGTMDADCMLWLPRTVSPSKLFFREADGDVFLSVSIENYIEGSYIVRIYDGDNRVYNTSYYAVGPAVEVFLSGTTLKIQVPNWEPLPVTPGVEDFYVPGDNSYIYDTLWEGTVPDAPIDVFYNLNTLKNSWITIVGMDDPLANDSEIEFVGDQIRYLGKLKEGSVDITSSGDWVHARVQFRNTTTHEVEFETVLFSDDTSSHYVGLGYPRALARIGGRVVSEPAWALDDTLKWLEYIPVALEESDLPEHLHSIYNKSNTLTLLKTGDLLRLINTFVHYGELGELNSHHTRYLRDILCGGVLPDEYDVFLIADTGMYTCLEASGVVDKSKDFYISSLSGASGASKVVPKWEYLHLTPARCVEKTGDLYTGDHDKFYFGGVGEGVVSKDTHECRFTPQNPLDALKEYQRADYYVEGYNMVGSGLHSKGILRWVSDSSGNTLYCSSLHLDTSDAVQAEELVLNCAATISDSVSTFTAWGRCDFPMDGSDPDNILHFVTNGWYIDRFELGDEIVTCEATGGKVATQINLTGKLSHLDWTFRFGATQVALHPPPDRDFKVRQLPEVAESDKSAYSNNSLEFASWSFAPDIDAEKTLVPAYFREPKILPVAEVEARIGFQTVSADYEYSQVTGISVDPYIGLSEVSEEDLLTIGGTVQEDGQYVSRVVRLYEAATGIFVAETSSLASTGVFRFSYTVSDGTLVEGTRYFVVAVPQDESGYNAEVFYNITPILE